MINCTFENGNKASLRHTVIDVLIIQDGLLLMIKRSNKILEGNKWALVGGFVDRDETISQAVERETREESGYTLKDIKLLWINDHPQRPNEDGRQNIAFVFYATPVNSTNTHDWEVKEVKWFPLNDLPDKETIAFDHYLSIQKYIALQKGETVPILEA